MKVNDVNRLQGINKYRTLDQKEKEIKQKNLKKDQISISEEAKALLEQTKQPTDKHRVKEIKEQIENENYKIDVLKTAEKMLEWFNK